MFFSKDRSEIPIEYFASYVTLPPSYPVLKNKTAKAPSPGGSVRLWLALGLELSRVVQMSLEPLRAAHGCRAQGATAQPELGPPTRYSPQRGHNSARAPAATAVGRGEKALHMNILNIFPRRSPAAANVYNRMIYKCNSIIFEPQKVKYALSMLFRTIFTGLK